MSAIKAGETVNSPNDVLRARNGYIWLLLAPFLIIVTTLAIAFLNYSYWICVSDEIECGRNGAKYLNYAIGLLPSALWYIFLLPNTFHNESAFVRKHGKRALAQAGILLGVALLGMLVDWLTRANGTIFNITFVLLFVIWLFNISQLNNFIKENGLKKEENIIKENSPKEENDLKSSDNEKSATNPIWIIIPIGLLAALFFWSSLDYEAQGNFLMAGAVFLIPAGALLLLAAFIWGWIALISLLTKMDKKFDDKRKVDKPSRTDTETDIKDKSE